MFEQEVRKYLAENSIVFEDGTRSNTSLDFFLPRHKLYFDVKEKSQPSHPGNWGEATTAKEDLFIVDDLAARTLLLHAPRGFCLMEDSSAKTITYFVYSIVDLLCIPKKRVRRPIERTVRTFKGKWLVDLRDAAVLGKSSLRGNTHLRPHAHTAVLKDPQKPA